MERPTYNQGRTRCPKCNQWRNRDGYILCARCAEINFPVTAQIKARGLNRRRRHIQMTASN